MRTATAILAVCLAAASPLRAQDKVHLRDGAVREGQIAGIDANSLRLRIPSPIPGQPPPSTTIPRGDIVQVEFGPDAVLESLAKNKTAGAAAAARVRWEALQPFLDLPASRSAQAGCLLGEILLLSPEKARHEEALALFQTIEAGAWNPADREMAKRGRLSAMLKLGRLEEASAEAEQIAATAEDPQLLIETRLLLASARLASLRQLLEDNPRWSEDPPVRAERARLLNDTADLALYPFLFHGTSRAQAARGLGIALDLYRLVGDKASARGVATDLVELYPETPEAAGAAAEAKPEPEQS
jgi:hypothetical protein